MLKKKNVPTSISKGLGKGASISEDQLAKIRKFTLDDIPADQLYVRKMLLAHNAIDRDNERFSEKILEDFAATLPGKSVLIGHEWGPPGKGLYFDAHLEEMDLQAARSMTGEDLKLPDGVTQFRALFAWFYTVKTADKESLLADIDAGIIRHVSIGFKAANLVRVSNEQTGETLFYEYKGPGEAREGSLVWLGAQPGATITKGAEGADGADIDEDENKRKKEIKDMKRVLVKLGLGEDATVDQALSVLNQKTARLNSVEEIISPLGDNPSKAQVEELMKASDDGKAYRKDLIAAQVKYERLLGRIGDSDKDVTDREKQLARRDLSEIKGDITHLEKLVREKFPNEASIKGGDPNAGKGADADKVKKYALCS